MHKYSLPIRRTGVVLAGIAGMACATTNVAHAAPARHHHPLSAAAAGRLARFGQPPAGIERANRSLFLSIGEGEIINLPAGVSDVWTSNPGAADVYVNNDHQIHLFGKAFGEATVFATTASGAVVYAAHVTVAQNSTSLDPMLRAAFPDADIKITIAGQIAVLTGTVATPLDSTQAEALVKVALNPGVKPNSDDPVKFAVINRLRTATPLQINLRVRIAEVSRSLAKQLQANLASANTSSGFQYGIGQGRAMLPNAQNAQYALGVGVTPTTGGVITGYTASIVNGQTVLVPTYGTVTDTAVSALSTATTLASQFKLGPLSLIAALDAGEQAGLVTTLAEPNLTAMSGETADFLAGGQYPIPVSEGLGTVSVEYKNYGISLSYTPTVLANGNISLHVRPEVSEIDPSHSVTLNGYIVPALTTRRAETTVELGSGQSFMIAGLLSNNAQNTIQKMPGAGDVPVLGALFKSTAFQRGETELVIVVTPYLVNPVNDGDIKLPTDGFQNPDDIKRVLGNMISDGKSGDVRPGPTAAPAPGKPTADASSSTSSKQPRTADATTSLAQPGFTLN